MVINVGIVRQLTVARYQELNFSIHGRKHFAPTDVYYMKNKIMIFQLE
jgi:hypothetical protein